MKTKEERWEEVSNLNEYSSTLLLWFLIGRYEDDGNFVQVVDDWIKQYQEKALINLNI